MTVVLDVHSGVDAVSLSIALDEPLQAVQRQAKNPAGNSFSVAAESKVVEHANEQLRVDVDCRRAHIGAVGPGDVEAELVPQHARCALETVRVARQRDECRLVPALEDGPFGDPEAQEPQELVRDLDLCRQRRSHRWWLCLP